MFIERSKIVIFGVLLPDYPVFGTAREIYYYFLLGVVMNFFYAVERGFTFYYV